MVVMRSSLMRLLEGAENTSEATSPRVATLEYSCVARSARRCLRFVGTLSGKGPFRAGLSGHVNSVGRSENFKAH
jgi:hypothetical protein